MSDIVRCSLCGSVRCTPKCQARRDLTRRALHALEHGTDADRAALASELEADGRALAAALFRMPREIQ